LTARRGGALTAGRGGALTARRKANSSDATAGEPPGGAGGGHLGPSGTSSAGRYTPSPRHWPGRGPLLTTPRLGEADPRSGAPGRSLRASAAGPAIALVLLGGLCLRLLVAYVLLPPPSGHAGDLNTFVSWSLALAEHGLARFYGLVDPVANYPPGHLYLLWLVGIGGQWLGPVLGTDAHGAALLLVKLQGIVADVGVAYLLYRIGRGWVRASGVLPVAAAGLYLFNPVSWYNSAVWGQVDALGALVMLAAVALLLKGHSEGAAVAVVVAGLVKPQFGIVLAPLLTGVLLRRHLLVPGSGPHPRRLPAWARDWLVHEQGPWRLVSSAAAGMLAAILLIAPFSIDLPQLLARLVTAAEGYHWLTLNAYNHWAFVGSGGIPPLAFLPGVFSDDTVPLVGPVPGVALGGLLLGVAFVLALVRVAWRAGRRSILVVAVFLAMAFFLLPTRVHERYLFPVFAFLPLLAVLDRRWLVATVALTAASFVNLHGVLTAPYHGTLSVVTLPFGEVFRTYPAVGLAVVAHLAVFAFTASRLRPATGATSAAAASPRPLTHGRAG
jgi:dolichyl-phosphate-mannose-protein mannosyltransferase